MFLNQEILERNFYLRYPIDFDDNIRQQTENCSDNDQRKRIREFASMTAIGFKHQVRKYKKKFISLI
jgi:hypothetical protein